jgi:hypothetical protein
MNGPRLAAFWFSINPTRQRVDVSDPTYTTLPKNELNPTRCPRVGLIEICKIHLRSLFDTVAAALGVGKQIPPAQVALKD